MTKKLSTEEKNRQVEEQIKKNLEHFTESQHLAVTKIARAFRFGCNWGFVMKGEDLFKDKIDVIKEEQYTTGLATMNGAIMLASENWLIETINSVTPLIDFSFVNKANERRMKERELFQKHLQKAMECKGKGVSRNRYGTVDVAVGIYSSNDTNMINSNGGEYPAFKLNIEDVMYIMLETASASNRNVHLGVKTKDGQVGVVNARHYYMQSPDTYYKDIMRHTEIFESETGVLLRFVIE